MVIKKFYSFSKILWVIGDQYSERFHQEEKTIRCSGNGWLPLIFEEYPLGREIYTTEKSENIDGQKIW